MTKLLPPWVRATLLTVPLLYGTACSINPATGKPQLMLVSEAQEREIGRQNDAAIVAQMGLYDDPDLQAYVADVGRRLAAESERPDLDWTFRVVDEPVVNAFALPGGYIYVTRGILAYMQSEAELAAVLGHEIGHVTARHGASQMSKAQLAQLGLGVGSVLAPEKTDQFGGLAVQGLGVAFLKFSRDDERQADDLGLRYLVAEGYDPRPMGDMFDMLYRVGRAAGADGAVPGWLLTHPEPESRQDRAEARIERLGPVPDGRRVGRETFLEKLGGVVYGSDPRQGYFVGERFFHPELRFRLAFPGGWATRNARDAVAALAPSKDAVVRLTLADADGAAAALEAFMGQDGVESTGPAMGSIGGLPTRGEGFVARTSSGVLRGRVGFVEYGGRVYGLLGYATEAGWATHESALRSALASFERLDDPAALDVRPHRIEIVRPDRDLSPDAFATRYGSAIPAAELALINRVDEGGRFEAGGRYKVVRGGRLPG